MKRSSFTSIVFVAVITLGVIAGGDTAVTRWDFVGGSGWTLTKRLNSENNFMLKSEVVQQPVGVEGFL